MTFVSASAHYSFDSFIAATEALLAVMEDMRSTSRRYRIIGRSPEVLYQRGLTVEGEIDEVSELLADIPGVILRDS